jgi:hypothetical protein
MRTRMLVAVVAVSLFGASGAFAQTAEVVRQIDQDLNLKRLKGTWLPELRITKSGAEQYPNANKAIVFDGETFTRFEARQAVAMGKFKIEDGFLRLSVESSSPWDLEATDTRKAVQYAFKVDGDVLTLCYTVGDKGKADDLTPGEGRQVVVYKRQKEARAK